MTLGRGTGPALGSVPAVIPSWELDSSQGRPVDCDASSHQLVGRIAAPGPADVISSSTETMTATNAPTSLVWTMPNNAISVENNQFRNSFHTNTIGPCSSARHGIRILEVGSSSLSNSDKSSLASSLAGYHHYPASPIQRSDPNLHGMYALSY